MKLPSYESESLHSDPPENSGSETIFFVSDTFMTKTLLTENFAEYIFVSFFLSKRRLRIESEVKVGKIVNSSDFIG